jgi:hypothetical protein
MHSLTLKSPVVPELKTPYYWGTLLIFPKVYYTYQLISLINPITIYYISDRRIYKMAKVTGPLFSMAARGSFGDIVFDRRGFAYLKSSHRDAQTASQGDFRQAMTVAQKCVKVCGPTTRQLLRAAANSGTWNAYLSKNLIGSNRAAFNQYWQVYQNDPTIDQAGWEAAATSMGMVSINLDYANQSAVSPGAQLFMLASTLFSVGLYTAIGQPNGNFQEWRDNIVS